MAPLDFDSTTLFDCSGLIAVITGGGTGLGLCMAKALARNGATVYILGRRLSKLEEAVAACSTIIQGKVIPLECDATSKSSLESAAAQIAKQTGYINLLIANAGIAGPQTHDLLPRAADDPKGPMTIQYVQERLWNIPLDDVVQTYKVNVAGTLYTTLAFLDLLDKGNARQNVDQKSQVIVTSSIAGYHRNFPQVGLSYTTSKAAVNLLVKSLASFLVQFKIRVNAIAPGLFPSEMTEGLFNGKDVSVEGSLPKTSQPLERAGREEEMAGTVLYYASKAGAFCSGSIHVIDGGRLGGQPGATY